MDPLKTSDVVLIGTTLLLGATALAAPALGEWLKRRFWAPLLRPSFSLSNPDCHRTQLDLGGNMPPLSRDTFIYRLRVRNSGRAQARRCEVVIESIAKADAAGRYIPHPKYTPVPLTWGAGYGEMLDLNPGREAFCDLFFVLHPDHNRTWLASKGLIEWPATARTGNGLKICTERAFYSQPNWLTQGKYELTIAFNAENTHISRYVLAVAWTGVWHDDEAAIFQECVASLRPA